MRYPIKKRTKYLFKLYFEPTVARILMVAIMVIMYHVIIAFSRVAGPL